MARNSVFLRSVSGEHVAFTGSCAPWPTQRHLVRDLRRHGARARDDGELNNQTRVLVRGISSAWKHSKFGKKEAEAADRIRAGQRIVLVASEDLYTLLDRGKPARRLDYVAGQPVKWLEPTSKKDFLDVTLISGPLDREHTAKGRVEQSYLRAQLLQKRTIAECEMCGQLLPADLLVAAHIKPRSDCTMHERRDAQFVVFLLCSLGCDALYERGYVSVDDRGRFLIARIGTRAGDLRRRLASTKELCRVWTAEASAYFEWHRENRYRGAAL
jgi:hypothetical protein